MKKKFIIPTADFRKMEAAQMICDSYIGNGGQEEHGNADAKRSSSFGGSAYHVNFDM